MMPEGWVTTSLENEAKVIDCKHRTPPYVENGIPVISPGTIKWGKIDLETPVKRVTQEEYKSLMDHCIIDAGDIVLSRNQSVGVACYIKTPVPFVLGQDTVLLKPTNADSRFLFYCLQSNQTQRTIYKLAGGSTFSRINLKEIRNLKLTIPPLPEQTKIAKILSTWDKAIATVEKSVIIAKQRRDGLLQRLLENKTWPLIKLGDLGQVSSAGVDKNTNADEKPIRLLNYLDVLNRDFILNGDLNHWVTAPERKIANCNIRKGDVFFTPSSETRDDIAHSAVALEDIENAAYSYHVVRFRLDEPWDLNFRAYAFKTAHFYKQAFHLCEGSGQRYVLSQRYFREMTVRVPPIEEQNIIGATLRAADEEKNNLKATAEKLRNEKKALMQQLLTGKRQVKVKENTAYMKNKEMV